MAVTSKNTPYVQSSDLVSAFPSSSLALANHIDANLMYNAVTINPQTGTTYAFVLADATLSKLVTASNAAAQTYTVNAELTTAWPTGSTLSLLNIGAGAVTVVGAATVTVNNASAVISQWESVILVKTGTNTWTMVRGGGLPKASFSGQIGAASVDTTTRPGKTIVTFQGNGSLTCTAGLVEILVIGGGGGGAFASGGGVGGGGGGGGGHYYSAAAYIPIGTVGSPVVVTIGAGGPQFNMGSPSQVGNIVSPGGGRGGGGAASSTTVIAAGGPGGSGGGSNAGAAAGAAIFTGYGFAGGTGGSSANTGGGGGGGGGAVGTSVTGASGGAGGAGASTAITGSAVLRAGGGSGGSNGGSVAGGSGGGGAGGSNGSNGTAGSPNLGGGGGGGGTNPGVLAYAGAAGGSGLVIVVFG